MPDFITNPDHARIEIEAAVKFRQLHTDASREMIKRVAGKEFRTDWSDTDDHFENFGFQYVSTFLPNMVFSAPKVECDSEMLDSDHPAIVAMQAGMNGWVKKSKLQRQLILVANDLAYSFGCGIVTLEDMPGGDADARDNADRWDMEQIEAPTRPMLPMFRRISPFRVFRDPQAMSGDECRFSGHMWIRDKADLLRAKNADGTPKFDRETVKQLTENAGVDEILEDSDPSRARMDGQVRNQVCGYEFYVPETGMIYTLGYTPGDAGRSVFLRKPRPYFGRREGPYVFFGINIIPDQVYPLPPLAVTASLDKEYEAHAGQASDDAGSAKRLIVVDGSNKESSDRITTSANGSVVVIPGFVAGSAQAIEFGGAQRANLEYMQFLKDRWERLTGVNETIRGNITGATATETNLAQQSQDSRTRFGRDRFNEGVIEVLESAAYFLHESDLCRFHVKILDPMTGKMVPKLFIGGPQPGMEYIRFEDLQISITPFSTEYVDESVRQRRMQQASQILLQVVPALIQFPFLKAREVIDDLFESVNVRGAANRYIDFAMLEQARGLAMQTQAAGAMSATAGAVGEMAGATGAVTGDAGGADAMEEYAAILAEAA